MTTATQTHLAASTIVSGITCKTLIGVGAATAGSVVSVVAASAAAGYFGYNFIKKTIPKQKHKSKKLLFSTERSAQKS